MTVAQGLADTLLAVSDQHDYGFTACVTPMEPSWDCERIHVWPSTIVTEQPTNGPCMALPRVTFTWAIAVCVGSEPKNEDCAWWEETFNGEGRTARVLHRLWAMYAGLNEAYISGALCTAMGGVQCHDMRLGQVLQFDSADLVVYAGTVTVPVKIVPSA